MLAFLFDRDNIISWPPPTVLVLGWQGLLMYNVFQSSIFVAWIPYSEAKFNWVELVAFFKLVDEVFDGGSYSE